MVRMGFTLSRELAEQWRAAVVREGYGARGKSRWTCEAIEQLISEDPLLQWVGRGSDLETRDSTADFRLTDLAGAALEKAVRVLRRQDPSWEGVRPDIVRAAIRWRIAHPLAATVAEA